MMVLQASGSGAPSPVVWRSQAAAMVSTAARHADTEGWWNLARPAAMSAVTLLASPATQAEVRVATHVSAV
jgi:hypothetical protein